MSDITQRKMASGSGSGGSSLFYETPTETPNGTVGQTFTVQNNPIALVSRGQYYIPGDGITVTGSGPYTVTVDNAIYDKATTIYESAGATNSGIPAATPTADPLVWTIGFNPTLIVADNQPMYNGVGVDVTGSSPTWTLTFPNAPTTVACLH